MLQDNFENNSHDYLRTLLQDFFKTTLFCQTPVLSLGLGVDFTFACHNNDNNDNNHNHNNPHLNFVKGTVLGDKDQGLGIRDKG